MDTSDTDETTKTFSFESATKRRGKRRQNYLNPALPLPTQFTRGSPSSNHSFTSPPTTRDETTPKKRVITATTNWHAHITAALLADPVAQIAAATSPHTDPITTIIRSQIAAKIAGYHRQDHEKNMYDATKCVTVQNILAHISDQIATHVRCHYCSNPLLFLYEDVRNPRQWTVDRVDNSRGHDRDNYVLACLECNLRRRCRHAEEYLLTTSVTFTRSKSAAESSRHII